MSLLTDGLRVVKDPSNFFSEKRSQEGLGYPLKFAALFVFASALIKSVTIGISFAGIGGLTEKFQGLFLFRELVRGAVVAPEGAAIISFFDAFIEGFLLLFIEALIFYTFVKLFGGEGGYKRTLTVVGYTTSLFPVYAFVNFLPEVGNAGVLILQIYGLYVAARGFEHLHSMEFRNALLAAFFPLILAFILGFTFTLGSRLALV